MGVTNTLKKLREPKKVKEVPNACKECKYNLSWNISAFTGKIGIRNILN